MRKLKSIIVVALVVLGTQFTTAQAKVAHIDVSVLMNESPQMKAAETQINKLKETYNKEYETMVQEFQTKRAKYEQEAPTAGDALNETRSKEMQDMAQRIQQYQQTISSELEKKQVEILKPIMEKATAAIQKVGREKGYSYVIDSSQGSGIMLADGPNLLDDVKKELGF